MAEVVHAKVAVDPISIHAILVGVDAGGEDEEVEAAERLVEISKDLPDLLERAQIAFFPVDLCIGCLFFDRLDGFLALFFLAVDHDHLGTAVGQDAGYLEADAECTASDDGDTTLEVCGLDWGWAESSGLLQDGLHGG